MLRTRVIPILLYKPPTLVKGKMFDSWRRVGSALQAVKVYGMREVDEIVFLDITATKEKRKPDMKLINEITSDLFIPLAIGGGIRTVEDARMILKTGADKIVINSIIYEDPDIITKMSKEFGSQSITVSIDYRGHTTFSNSGTISTGKDIYEVIKMAEDKGAGEILLTCIDKEGTMSGYDYDSLKSIHSGIPIIVNGGAGSYSDMVEALNYADAVAASSIFHFTDMTPKGAREYLETHGKGYQNGGAYEFSYNPG